MGNRQLGRWKTGPLGLPPDVCHIRQNLLQSVRSSRRQQETRSLRATAESRLSAGGPLKLRKQTHFATWPRTAIYCVATSSQEIRGAVVFESKANEAVSDSLVARNVG